MIIFLIIVWIIIAFILASIGLGLPARKNKNDSAVFLTVFITSFLCPLLGIVTLIIWYYYLNYKKM